MDELSPITNDELLVALSEQSGDLISQYGPVQALDRRAAVFRTSHLLEEVDVRFDQEMTLRLLLKDVSRDALTPAARAAKPAWLYDPLREIEVYRDFMPRIPPGAPRCYAVVAGDEERRHVLLLERVEGRELFQIGDFAVWEAAARWLARMHASPECLALAEQERSHVVRANRGYCRQWIDRAVRFASDARPAEQVTALAALSTSYDRVLDALAQCPMALLHGEFYASNVLVADHDDATRICPVDWEMAAAGPALLDLAALVMGNWTGQQQRELAQAYYLEWSRLKDPPDFEEMLGWLDFCRLQVAVQWLGWSADWQPPSEHAHDWYAEAITLANKLLSR